MFQTTNQVETHSASGKGLGMGSYSDLCGLGVVELQSVEGFPCANQALGDWVCPVENTDRTIDDLDRSIEI